MPIFKLGTIKELFPDKSKEFEGKDREISYGKMFKIPEEKQKAIVKYMDAFVEEVKRQRQGLMELKAEGVRNYEGMKEESSGPWPGSSNISTMITTIASDMMIAKLVPMVWQPEQLNFQGVETHDDAIAENNAVMMRWALTKDMEDTQEKAYEIVHRLVVDGTVAIKRMWEIYYCYVTRVEPDRVDSKGHVIQKVIYDRVRRERERWVVRDIDYVYVTPNAENEQRAEIVDEVYYTLPMLKEMKVQGLLLPDVDLEKITQSVEKTFDPEGRRSRDEHKRADQQATLGS